MEEWSEGSEPKKFTVVHGGRDLLAPAASLIVTKEQERGQVPTVWMRLCSPTAPCVLRGSVCSPLGTQRPKISWWKRLGAVSHSVQATFHRPVCP